MYPYRRQNQRKRSRNPARRNKGGARRLPGTARELLPLMQPATKALAQVLAGNTKPSGQFVHARNMVDRADQMVVEKQLDRLTIRDREAFLEQLALLKLTVNDAEEEFGPLDVEPEDDGEEVADGDENAPEIDEPPVDEEAERAAAEAERQRLEAEALAQRERLKRVALALIAPAAGSEPPTQAMAPDLSAFEPPADDLPVPARKRAEPTTARGGAAKSSAAKSGAAKAGATASTSRRPRITLRSTGRNGESSTPAVEDDAQGVASEN